EGGYPIRRRPQPSGDWPRRATGATLADVETVLQNRFTAPRNAVLYRGVTTMAKRSLRILFIGNSFTARNNLPDMVAKLAMADGNRLDHQLITAGGASLRMHWNKGVAQKLIADGRFDFVVLQEQSTLPIKNPKRMRENVLLFDSAIKASGAKTALYMTWARQHAPQTQQQITDAYTKIAKEIGATLIP